MVFVLLCFIKWKVESEYKQAYYYFMDLIKPEIIFETSSVKVPFNFSLSIPYFQLFTFNSLLFTFHFQLPTFNFQLPSIPEATDRKTSLLSEGAPVRIAIAVIQVAEPGSGWGVLRRTPPVTVGANIAECTKVDAAVASRET